MRFVALYLSGYFKEDYVNKKRQQYLLGCIGAWVSFKELYHSLYLCKVWEMINTQDFVLPLSKCKRNFSFFSFFSVSQRLLVAPLLQAHRKRIPARKFLHLFTIFPQKQIKKNRTSLLRPAPRRPLPAAASPAPGGWTLPGGGGGPRAGCPSCRSCARDNDKENR